jgi:hypothetical protein
MSVGAVSVRESVEGAIRRAADATGVDFAFLMRTASRESAFNPRARAATSSAAGLFQFVEQTWLATLHRHGARHGYAAASAAIEAGADGRYRVRDPAARAAVLDLRFDPRAASAMAAELTASNAAYLRGRIGRDPTSGELYVAHFLGPAGAAGLIEAAASRPGAPAASLFPEAAAANRSIFRREGRAATVAEVYANLTGGASDRPVSIAPEVGRDAELSPDFVFARRLDRLDAERALLDMLLGGGEDARGSSLFTAQLLAAFGPENEGV